MKIIWLDEAIDDLFSYEQNSFIFTENKIENYITNLVEYVRKLSDLPYLGKEFFYHKEIKVRQLLYKMHRIIYYIENDEIRIVAVIHTARDINNVMKYIDKLFE